MNKKANSIMVIVFFVIAILLGSLLFLEVKSFTREQTKACEELGFDKCFNELGFDKCFNDNGEAKEVIFYCDGSLWNKKCIAIPLNFGGENE